MDHLILEDWDFFFFFFFFFCCGGRRAECVAVNGQGRSLRLYKCSFTSQIVVTY